MNRIVERKGECPHEKSFDLLRAERQLEEDRGNVEDALILASNKRSSAGIRLTYRFVVVPLSKISLGLSRLGYRLIRFCDCMDERLYRDID
ncbi:MAG: hypothetical protein KJ600_06035 [Nanoarchaeota archaeon]|nr:hypothetical protein [Nanoarchaeota archaeon]MBU1104087.1 hypothetical protein [Nanoarchaeota archaeon]